KGGPHLIFIDDRGAKLRCERTTERAFASAGQASHQNQHAMRIAEDSAEIERPCRARLSAAGPISKTGYGTSISGNPTVVRSESVLFTSSSAANILVARQSS